LKKQTMDMNEYTLGEGKLIYIPHWADDPDALFREAKKLSFTPEIVTMYGKESTIERQTVDYGLPYSYNKTAKPSIEWEGVAIGFAIDWKRSCASSYRGAHATIMRALRPTSGHIAIRTTSSTGRASKRNILFRSALGPHESWCS
jgi:hypothetical protein